MAFIIFSSSPSSFFAATSITCLSKVFSFVFPLFFLPFFTLLFPQRSAFTRRRISLFLFFSPFFFFPYYNPSLHGADIYQAIYKYIQIYR